MIYKADLHLHSCLSPCGSLDMSPRAIVERAVEIGINCLALTDHNSARNCAAMAKLCEREGILFFPGLEVTTAEEAHIVCLFGSVDAAMELGNMVYESLPALKYNFEKFGDQVVVNEDDEVVDMIEDKYLVMACGYTIDDLREEVARLGGLFIAAHVDKPCFSVVSQLGLLSGDFSAVELSRAGAMRLSNAESPPNSALAYAEINKFRVPRSAFPGYTTVSASDGHYLHNIGSACVEFESENASIEGYKGVLRNGQVGIVLFDHAFRTAPGDRHR
jgi:hypothetical protein